MPSKKSTSKPTISKEIIGQNKHQLTVITAQLIT
jgi:hypothetical protein